ncbi:M20/M25/M40 family metallo-hydrolase [Actinotignum sanguinis]|uniref:Dipeptidase n=2 Tax=Actinomycetaceae TaxID=2049 RepID=A0ABZ0RER3_9ACTO|nr:MULTISPECIES: dipeptidase [Actinotignum]WPJ89510.1 dipeptidase [Schaalia turicensis]MDE1655079.1 dipeptidase [Actinotignum schaalii]MDE1655958.1 dipeptidase [Actinotignum sanguinis]MDK7197614.1 dipeptidase [Actinotignum sanguinis]MDK8513242.1 dipeptidase [Actinotignum sanguinis]
MSSDLVARVDEALPVHRALLEDLVRIPSVSADAFDQAKVRESAEFVARMARERGFDVDIIELETPQGKGRPAILAHKHVGDDKPTILLYAHHDVQPQGTLEGWESDPFEPVEKNGRLYGRGTADDKAGVLVHMAAISALGDDLAVNVTLFIEGEEEIGSPTFHAFLETYRDRLQADAIVVADSGNWKVGVPSLTTSLRGVVRLGVEVSTLTHGVHSGQYGGPTLDAVTALARIIATLHDENGDVAVPGLDAWDDADVDYEEEHLRRDAAILPGMQLLGTGSFNSRMWTKPSIAVIGMDVTSTAEASNTVIPSARAFLSMRVAPGQDPQRAGELLAEYIEAQAPFGATVVTEVAEAGSGFKAGEDTPIMHLAREALSEAFGHESVDIGTGGSIPFISDLAEVFPEAEILVTGVEDPDARAHAHNESLHLGDWRNAILAEALLLEKLGQGESR